jgi:hypothetical protein
MGARSSTHGVALDAGVQGDGRQRRSLLNSDFAGGPDESHRGLAAIGDNDPAGFLIPRASGLCGWLRGAHRCSGRLGRSSQLEEDHAAGYTGVEDQLPAALFAFSPAPGPELDLDRGVIGGEATVRHAVSAPGDPFDAPVPRGHRDLGALGDLDHDQTWIRRAAGHPRGGTRLRDGHTEFICFRSLYDLLNRSVVLKVRNANGQ